MLFAARHRRNFAVAVQQGIGSAMLLVDRAEPLLDTGAVLQLDVQPMTFPGYFGPRALSRRYSKT